MRAHLTWAACHVQWKACGCVQPAFSIPGRIVLEALPICCMQPPLPLLMSMRDLHQTHAVPSWNLLTAAAAAAQLFLLAFCTIASDCIAFESHSCQEHQLIVAPCQCVLCLRSPRNSPYHILPCIISGNEDEPANGTICHMHIARQPKIAVHCIRRMTGTPVGLGSGQSIPWEG